MVTNYTSSSSSSFQNKRLKEWNSKDVSDWLVSIGMKAYIQTFSSEKISGKQLNKFNEDDLRIKCKITARPIRKILFKRLKHLQLCGDEESDDEEATVATTDSKGNDELNLDLNKASDNTLNVDMTIQNQVNESEKELEDANKPMSPNEASFKIQSMFHCRQAHKIVVNLIQQQFEKIYSLQTGRYEYKYVGRVVHSKIFPVEPLKTKPINLGSLDLPIKANRELAILKIQLFARYAYTLKRVREIIRQQWKKQIDPVSGKYFYFHPRSGSTIWRQPTLLGGERWNPMELKFWTVKDVKLFFRREQIGNTHIMSSINQYEIDGALLLIFDENDLVWLGITEESTRHMLLNLMQANNHHIHTDRTVVRKRNWFRQNCLILQSAIIIQRNIRKLSTRMNFMKLMYSINNKPQIDNYKWWSCSCYEIATVFDGISSEKWSASFKEGKIVKKLPM